MTKRTYNFSLRFTKTERAEWDFVAEYHGEPLAVIVRRLMREEAARVREARRGERRLRGK